MGGGRERRLRFFHKGADLTNVEEEKNGERGKHRGKRIISRGIGEEKNQKGKVTGIKRETVSGMKNTEKVRGELGAAERQRADPMET